MSVLSLILHNLKYYRKSWLAILAGMVISTAVLTGALVVGDSVRYSLGKLTDIRLGKTRFVVQSGNHFFRQQLASELSQYTKSLTVPLLQIEGIAVNSDKLTQANRVEVLGIDERFMKLWNSPLTMPGDDEAIISQNTAEKLKLKPGDELVLKVHKPSKAPENAPFVSEKEPLVIFRLKVAFIANIIQMGRFSLKSNQMAPFNIFIPLATLASKVDLNGNSNLILIPENESVPLSTQNLDSLIRLCWRPEDAGLRFSELRGNKGSEIRSDRIFIDKITGKAIQSAIPGAEPILTYLVNSISAKGRSTPYSFVTAAELPGMPLSGHEILINSWLASDLNVRAGDTLQLKYFTMGALRKLTEDSARFCIKLVLPLSDPIFDPSLMPDFPGMSDAGNCRNWETGAPIDLDKIRDKDEEYWNKYRGTPKAFISMDAGKLYWDNPFGYATAFRFKTTETIPDTLKNKLMAQLKPTENGFRIENVYTQGKVAAANSTDFGMLFLSLSFFIITAALLLTGMLYSLHYQTRMTETAVMAAIGFRKQQIVWILVSETSVVVLIGSLLGALAGILYTKLLLIGLNTFWNDAIRTSLLSLHIESATLFIGVMAGAIVSMFASVVVLLQNLRKPLSALVKGIEIPTWKISLRKGNISLALSILIFCIAFILMIYAFFSSRSELSELFLSSGALVMTGAIIMLYSVLIRFSRKTSVLIPGVYTILMRNASLRKRQTLSAVTLLAIGTFSVIITGANHKSFYGAEQDRKSGTGGFLSWAESTVPLLYDLNSPEGQQKYGLADEKELQHVNFIQMLRIDGNDASCLNLNQVSNPVVIGINPGYFDKKQAFSFLKLDKSVNQHHPWLTLNTSLAPDIIPGFADQTVITYGLHKNIGDTLTYLDENGKKLEIKIMGGIDNSIFQGNILIAANFLRQYFPSSGSSSLMLIDGDFNQQTGISNRLEYLFQDYGMVVTPASVRLVQFNSVENTYLSVFMLLGALGVLLGTFGLGIVVMRNVHEREAEIAMCLSIGFKKKFVMMLLVAEYTLLLLSGIFIGTISAFIGLAPSISNSAGTIPWLYIFVILLVILASGLLWIFFPVKNTLGKNLIQSLRSE